MSPEIEIHRFKHRRDADELVRMVTERPGVKTSTSKTKSGYVVKVWQVGGNAFLYPYLNGMDG